MPCIGAASQHVAFFFYGPTCFLSFLIYTYNKGVCVEWETVKAKLVSVLAFWICKLSKSFSMEIHAAGRKLAYVAYNYTPLSCYAKSAYVQTIKVCCSIEMCFNGHPV